MRRPFSVATCALALALLSFALPAAAGAASCTPVLNDAAGRPVTLNAEGSVSINSGTLGYAYIQIASYPGAAPNSCTSEEGGREVGYPEQPIGAPSDGIFASRKVFVPSTGRAFVRFLTIVRNASSVAQTISVRAYSGHGSSRVRGSGDGDAVLGTTDAWGVFADQPAPLAPSAPGPDVVGHVWDAAPGLGAAGHVGIVSNPGPFASLFTDPGNTPTAMYNVVVPAGAARTVMTLDFGRESGAPGLASALADAPALSAAPPEVYAGLSGDEIRSLVNWPDPDPDGDGVRLAADNCRTNANAGQENLDGDGLGDACDPDVDGDGLSDALEASLGSDPRRADTDGDGRPDGADACPKLAGSQPDGCPPASADTSPSGVTGASLSGVATKVSRKSFLKGLKVRTGCAEPCSVVAELRANAKGGVRSAAAQPGFRLLLGSATARRAAGLRTITVKPSGPLVGKARRFTVQLRVTLTDGAGNQQVRTKTITVG